MLFVAQVIKRRLGADEEWFQFLLQHVERRKVSFLERQIRGHLQMLAT